MSTDQTDQQGPSSPDGQQGAPRAAARGLEAYPSLLAAFAAPQPLHRHGLQMHKSTGTVQARVLVKTPRSKSLSDSTLPSYQHETDMALAVDVAVLWRALSRDWLPEHVSYRLEKCKFNHEAAGYLDDAALVAKLKSLPDFPALKVFLVEVLQPPPRPPKKRDGLASLKRKWAASDWPDSKRLYKGQGDLFEKLLTPDNLKGYGGAERLVLPVGALRAEPFEWQPADPASTEPPKILISCEELGVTDEDATVCNRGTDGYRMGKGTQGLLGKLKAQPGDVMQLRVTKKQGDTIYVDLTLKRPQAAAATGGSTGGLPSAGGAAPGGSVGRNPSSGGGAAAAGKAAGVPANPAEPGSPSREVSQSDFGSDDDDDGETHSHHDVQRRVSTGEQQQQQQQQQQQAPPVQTAQAPTPQALRGLPGGQGGDGHNHNPQALPFDGAVAAAEQKLAAMQGAQQERQQQQQQQHTVAPVGEQQDQEKQHLIAAGLPLRQQSQQLMGRSHSGVTSGGAGAAGGSSYPATAKLVERELQQRLADAVDALGEAADSERRLMQLRKLVAVGHGGVLMQEIVRRWGQLSEGSRELIAETVAEVEPGSDGQQLVRKLRLVLSAAGETWHKSIAEGGRPPSAGAAAERPRSHKWQQRAAQACEDAAAAALASSPAEVDSDTLLRPLSFLAVGDIGGAPIQEAVDGWAGFSRPQQLELFTDVLVAVHEGAWQQLEARLQEALQLLPRLAAQE